MLWVLFFIVVFKWFVLLCEFVVEKVWVGFKKNVGFEDFFWYLINVIINICYSCWLMVFNYFFDNGDWDVIGGRMIYSFYFFREDGVVVLFDCFCFFK